MGSYVFWLNEKQYFNEEKEISSHRGCAGNHGEGDGRESCAVSVCLVRAQLQYCLLGVGVIRTHCDILYLLLLEISKLAGYILCIGC